jgi:hypothetical protein
LLFHILLENVVELDVDEELLAVEFAQFWVVIVLFKHLREALFDVSETVNKLLVLFKDLAAVLGQLVLVLDVVDQLSLLERFVDIDYCRMFRISDEQLRFECGFTHIVLVGTKRVVECEEKEYVLSDLQLLDTSVDHVDLLRHFFVAAVGPDFETAVVQLVHVGVLELVEEHDFDIGDVFGIVLQVCLFEVGKAEFGCGWEGVKAPDLLPHSRPFFLAVDMRFLSFLINAHFDGFREQLSLGLA